MAVLSRPNSKALAQRLHKSKALRKRRHTRPQAKSTAHCSGRSGRRLASGGRTMAGSSARSPSAAPPALAALARGRDRRLAATALAAAKDRSADQRDTQAAVAPARSRDEAERARLRARSLMNCAASGLHLICHQFHSKHHPAAARRLEQLRVSALLGTPGRHAELRRLCAADGGVAGPPNPGPARRIQGRNQGGVDRQLPPPHSGRPLAMTSMRRSSCRATTILRSRKKTTVAPASRQT